MSSAKLPSWRDLPLGAAIEEPGSTRRYQTGDWRSQRPITDSAKCVECGLCWIFCPDSARYHKKEEKKYDSNLFYCKGCGICSRECPTGAISMKEEE